MSFSISRDHTGKPYHVSLDDGFCQTSRPFNPETDGWMEQMIDPQKMLGVRLGQETESLVHEVNALRRKNFELERDVEMWRTAAGFPSK